MPDHSRDPGTDQSDPECRCLARARRGERLRVAGIDGEDALAARLRASGLWEDAEIAIVGAAPFGDPLLVELHGFRLALRRSEAARVRVLPLGPGA